MNKFLAALSGNKTYLAAAGFMGLALFQLSTGDIPAAIHSGLAGVTALGLRHAISTTAEATVVGVAEAAFAVPVPPPATTPAVAPKS